MQAAVAPGCLALLSASLLAGCMFTNARQRLSPGKSDPVIRIHAGVAGVVALGKKSAINLNRLELVLTSSAEEVVVDEINAFTTPALDPNSTSGQTLSKNYVLHPLRSWKIVVTSRDDLDSIIHRDSAFIPVLYPGDTADANLLLSSRYAMYEANFIKIPGSISTESGEYSQELNINRLVLEINGAIVADSSTRRGRYFQAGGTHTLAYDYVPTAVQTGWTVRNAGAKWNLRAIAFTDENAGLALGDNGLATSTRGDSWQPAEGFEEYGFRAASAAVGEGMAVGEGGMIYTFEGTRLDADVRETLNGVHMLDRNTAWIVGETGVIRTTTDGGRRWREPSRSPTSESLHSVWFDRASVGWAVGNGGTVVRTRDGGDSWTVSSEGKENLNAVHFVNGEHGWAVGANGVILHSGDGGDSWREQTSGTSSVLNGVWFTHPDTGWAVGEAGLILHTEDGGATWAQEQSGTDDNLNAIYFNTLTGRGYIVGDRDAILMRNADNTVLVTLKAFGPMGDWNEELPLFVGHTAISPGLGDDQAVDMTLEWTGPTTGTGAMEAAFGRVGKVIVNGTVPGTIYP